MSGDDDMAPPTLSVLMCNHNHGHYLPVALRAMLEQSRLPDEIIVLDDASTDDSLEVLAGLSRESPLIRVERNECNLGVVPTMGRLLALASGDYVHFAASDDAVLPGMFEKSMRLLAEHPRAGLCSCLTRLMDETGRDTGLLKSAVVTAEPRFLDPRAGLEALRLHGPWIQGNAVVYRRDALLSAGGFRPQLESFCDGFVHQVITLKHGVCFIPEPLTSWRRMASGYSSTTAVDRARSLAISRHAVALMRTTYRDLFPEDYVTAWERVWRRTVAISIARGSFSSAMARWTPGTDTPSAGARRRLLGAGAGLLARLRLLAKETALLLRLDDFPGRWLRRKLTSWRNRRKAGLTTAPDPRFSHPLEVSAPGRSIRASNR